MSDHTSHVLGIVFDSGYVAYAAKTRNGSKLHLVSGTSSATVGCQSNGRGFRGYKMQESVVAYRVEDATPESAFACFAAADLCTKCFDGLAAFTPCWIEISYTECGRDSYHRRLYTSNEREIEAEIREAMAD